ncbi:hypothetical protein PQ43W_57 [Ralstonia phage PQ43W]
MNLLCWAFGHKLPRTSFGTAPYLDQQLIGIDAMSTKHFALTGHCARCGRLIELGRFHVTKSAA